jgi:hypothetical protein
MTNFSACSLGIRIAFHRFRRTLSHGSVLHWNGSFATGNQMATLTLPKTAIVQKFDEPPVLGENDDSGTTTDRAQQIREAAHRRFEARGGLDGDEVQDWLDAEAEIGKADRSDG